MSDDFFPALSGNPLPPEDPGYTYGSILPYRYASSIPGTPRTPGTPVEFAIPSEAREAINSLASALKAPREALLGHLSEPEIANAGENMSSALMNVGMGVPAPGGVLASRMFGGPLAKTADTQALGQAFTLESRLKSAGYGADAIRDAVHKATGWFRGADDKWRFEIPDSQAKLLPPGRETGPGYDVRLSDILHHPDLYAAYPDIANTRVEPMPRSRDSLGSYNAGDNLIRIAPGSDEQMLSTLLHEPQHAIQDRENFAYGGSPSQFLAPDWGDAYDEGLRRYEGVNDTLRSVGIDPSKVNAALKASQTGTTPVLPDAQQHLETLQNYPHLMNSWLDARNNMQSLHSERENAWNMYNGLAGEVEARLVQARQRESQNRFSNTLIGDNYYKQIPPWQSSAWVPYDEQIVQFPDGSTLGEK